MRYHELLVVCMPLNVLSHANSWSYSCSRRCAQEGGGSIVLLFLHPLSSITRSNIPISISWCLR